MPHNRTLPIRCLPLLLAACSNDPPPPEPQWQLRPGTAQALPPPADAAAADTVATTDPVARRKAEALQRSLQQAARAPDPARRIPPEAARAAVRSVRGVGSVVWVDEQNLLVLVDGNAQRSHQMIEEICYQLEPLGDTLGVVVNLQSAAARNADELAILSRNCQLLPGQRAVAQPHRQLDALSPEVRARYRAGKAAIEAERQRRHTQGDKAAIEAIPEI